MSHRLDPFTLPASIIIPVTLVMTGYLFTLAAPAAQAAPVVACSYGNTITECYNSLISGGFGLPPLSSSDPTDSALDKLGEIINFLLGLVAMLALLALVIAGIMYILALGDESKAARAKNIALYAVLGLLLAGVAYLIIATVYVIFT